MFVQVVSSHAELARRVTQLERELVAAQQREAEVLEQQAALADVLKVISRSAFRLHPVLKALIENATRLCGADQGVLFRLDGERYRAAATSGVSVGLREYLVQNPIGAARAFVTGQLGLERWAIQVPDVRVDPDPELVEPQRLGEVRTALGVPLFRGDTPIGVIAVWRTEVCAFSDREVEVVETLADQAVIAIENTRLFNEIQDKSRQLEQVRRHKSEFLATMSHELRTSLNAIIGCSEVLSKQMFGAVNAQQGEYLQGILSSGQHLLSLVNDILDLSKVEAGTAQESAAMERVWHTHE